MSSLNPFLQRHADDILGVLQGFDRLRFRGTLRLLAHTQGMRVFLNHIGVRLTDFGSYVESVTTQVKEATEGVSAAAGRPPIYLPRPDVNKEQLAQDIARRDHITAGLICTLKTVEACWSYDIHRNRATHHLELVLTRRKCLHYYHYLLHPRFGFLHVRLQSWFPFTVHLCLNGREWLAHQMDAAGLAYRRHRNCFPWIADFAAAQQLADQQLRVAWGPVLDALVRQVHPAHAEVFPTCPVPYYWSLEQSEWATDVVFRSPAALASLYPQLIAHGMQQLHSRDVMRYFNKRAPREVVTDLAEVAEGVRLKHRVNGNALKMYDKVYAEDSAVLRIESTINDARDLRVYRRAEGETDGPKRWRPLRKGVADVRRRAAVSQQANERYLAALAAVDRHTPLGTLSRDVCRRRRWQGRSVRALNPLAADDGQLLAAINRGEWLLTGFRNRDLCRLGTARTPGAVTRQLRLLRAHRLIRKVSHTHRYVVTVGGHDLIAAFLAARQADTATLTKSA